MLRDVSLGVAAGSVTGLLGPSGCGKTTLMRAIVGVQHRRRRAGDGARRAGGRGRAARRVGYVTQAPSVYTDLSVGENLRYFARSLGVGASARRRGARYGGARRPRRPGRGFALGRRARARVAGHRAARRARAARARRADRRPGPRAARRAVGPSAASPRGGATLLVSSHVMDEAAECDALLLMREGAMLAADHARGAARADRRARPRARVPGRHPWAAAA